MKVQDDCVVSIHYRLTAEDGQQLDASRDQEPLAYLHGHSNLIPGLERELTEREPGENLQAVVPPEEAYGAHDDELVQKVPHEAFSGVEKVEPGMQFEAQDEQGNTQRIIVREVEDDGVVIDANHPLAGVTLHFDVEVDGVREATADELNNGQVQAS